MYTIPGVTCNDTFTVFVTVTALEDATFNYSFASYCQNEADPTPTISGTSGGTFTSSPAGLSITSGTGVIDLDASTPGTYGVLYTTPSAGCGDTLTVFVTVNAVDDASFSYTASTFCLNDANPTPTITGTTGGTFTINNGGTINPTTGELDMSTSGAGSYTITYTTSGVCPANTSVTITIDDQLDATITPVGPFCEGDASVTLVAVDAGGTFTGTGVTGTTFSPSVAGAGSHQIIYSVGTGNCGDSDTIQIVVNSNPVIQLEVTDDNCFNEEGSIKSVITGGTPTYNYSWESGENTPDLEGLMAETYTLTVFDSQGCSASSTATVEDNLVDCDYHVFLPNIFSPNGDGVNDVFLIEGKGIKTVNLTIYSRWGEKVFETNDQDIGWDGTFKGQEMNTAVFVYYLRATMLNNEVIEQKGNVALVK